ncbi:WD40 repeat domain-containing protein [Kribbella sp. NPDC051952]|uniref:WD40 repeat domain-containing protein n=1 Tax=Kribbella sp. NPDC051952 TaxID=3154851 RepID=UPI003430BCDD
MNDTETRLRDYLHAKADTVPNSAQGPGLELDATGTTTRRGWIPIALAAAGIAAVLTLAVPFLHGLTHKAPTDPAGAPTPPAPGRGPVSGAAPSIPYTVTVQDNPDNPLDTWWRTLYDHGKTVRNPGVHGNVLGRFGDNSWLIQTGYPNTVRLAVLDPAGKVRPFGPSVATGPIYSPDHKQLAVTELSHYGTPQVRGQVVVLDPGTGKKIASLDPPAAGVQAVAWTKDGIFFGNLVQRDTKLYLWQPGNGQARQLRGIQSPNFVQFIPATNKLLDFTAKGCPRIGVLRGDEFVAEHEYCDTPDASYGSVPSPNGRTLFNRDKKVAIDLYTGATTTLKLPGRVETAFSASVFEDPTNMILVTSVGESNQNMYRCSVATGECKVLRTAKANEMLGAVTP